MVDGLLRIQVVNYMGGRDLQRRTNHNSRQGIQGDRYKYPVHSFVTVPSQGRGRGVEANAKTTRSNSAEHTFPKSRQTIKRWSTCFEQNKRLERIGTV